MAAVLALGLAFWLGRRSAPTPEAAALECPPDEPTLSATATATSAEDAIALCPCPRPPPPRKKIAARPRPATPKVVDPTGATAQFLRDRAASLVGCAPESNTRTALHLELLVAPDGKVEAVHIKNVDPVSDAVRRCVESKLLAIVAPPFAGFEREAFWLTVVL